MNHLFCREMGASSRITNLGVMQVMGWYGADVIQCGLRPTEMKRIYQDTCV